VRSLSSRLERIERQVKENVAAQRCPLCLDRNVWRLRVNGERKLHDDDLIYDDDWHCRECGAAAPEIHIVTPRMHARMRNEQPLTPA
jgi:hypothetical protein